MEDSVFWNNLARHLSSNEEDKPSRFKKNINQRTDSKMKEVVREASLIFGKSEKEIEDLFQRMITKLDS
ncbi:MAG: hypothetical protein AAF789_05615 [Bacteroidota bacterium]